MFPRLFIGNLKGARRHYLSILDGRISRFETKSRARLFLFLSFAYLEKKKSLFFETDSSYVSWPFSIASSFDGLDDSIFVSFFFLFFFFFFNNFFLPFYTFFLRSDFFFFLVDTKIVLIIYICSLFSFLYILSVFPSVYLNFL